MCKVLRVVEEPHRTFDLRVTRSESGALVSCLYRFERSADFGRNDHVGFVRVANCDVMLRSDNLTFRTQLD
jgi:hypothetical protein